VCVRKAYLSVLISIVTTAYGVFFHCESARRQMRFRVFVELRHDFRNVWRVPPMLISTILHVSAAIVEGLPLLCITVMRLRRRVIR